VVEIRRVVVVVVCVVGVLWLAPVSPAARAAPGPIQAVAGAAASGGAMGGRNVLADFNADTYADLAVGAPFEDDSGVVNVIYGSASGLSATAVPDQLWGQGSPSVEGNPVSGDWFGWSVVAADFGGSIHADLAVGVPEENGGEGAVNVIYGSAAGLSATATPDQLWSQDTQDVEGTAGGGDSFGRSLAAGDFNDDGDVDLAIGVRGEGGGEGAVNVIYGSAAGLSATATPDQLWSQGSPNVEGTPNGGDEFGFSVAAT
jgi:hypothetical protein